MLVSPDLRHDEIPLGSLITCGRRLPAAGIDVCSLEDHGLSKHRASGGALETIPFELAGFIGAPNPDLDYSVAKR